MPWQLSLHSILSKRQPQEPLKPALLLHSQLQHPLLQPQHRLALLSSMLQRLLSCSDLVQRLSSLEVPHNRLLQRKLLFSRKQQLLPLRLLFQL